MSEFPASEITQSLTEPLLAGGPVVRAFGDYELLEEIARGGMGVVYKARQVSLNRTVALKMIKGGQLASAAEMQRFQTEAEAAAHLDHPHIVPVYDVGEYQGQQYFSMRLVEGADLGRSLHRFVHDPHAAARIVASVARAVHYAHQRGILHRDLKPANILLDQQGQPHVTDFGLAKRLEGDTSQTQSGAILGTPSYTAPEQAAGRIKQITTSTDVYGLGAILYELLTGQPPFRADTPLETLRQVVEREPVRPGMLNPGTPRDLETICLKCLKKEPTRRYSSAEALALDLDHWLAGEPIQARPAGTWERLGKWARRRPATAALLAVSTVAAAALVSIILFSNARLQRERNYAVEQEGKADWLRLQAEERERAVRRHLYTARMSWAQQALEKGQIEHVRELLLHDAQPSAEGHPDLRGFEWYYLWRLCQRDNFALRGHTGPVSSVAY